MAWLAAHMWAILAGAAALGLLLGWAFRGILLKGKARKAMVERDVAQTELAQARDEIEGLYTAQRNSGAAAVAVADASASSDLTERENRLTELTAELAQSKSELETLKMAGSDKTAATAAVTAIAGAGAGAALSASAEGEEDQPSLVWRNRHLESRVRSLETQIHEMGDTAPAAVMTGAAPAADANVEMDKLTFKNTELQQRVSELEEQIISGGSVVATGDADGDTPDEELARLRWRNRFLEGRLAYFEGDEGAEQVDEADEEGGPGGLVTGAAAAAGAALVGALALGGEAEAEIDAGDSVEEITEGLQELAADTVDTTPEPEMAAEVIEVAAHAEAPVEDITDEMAAEIESAVAEAADDAVEEVEVALGEVETEAAEDISEAADNVSSEVFAGVAPLKLDGPVGGQADDLTVIGGVGPKIQEVLNELGVYHYDQIAAWTPENVAWVDEHLSFSGRIGREDWVGQASALAGADVDA